MRTHKSRNLKEIKKVKRNVWKRPFRIKLKGRFQRKQNKR